MRPLPILLALALAPAIQAAEVRITPLEQPAVTAAVGLLRLQLVLPGAVVRAGKDGNDRAHDVTVVLNRSEGVWSGGAVMVPGFNRGRHVVRQATVVETGGRLSIQLGLSVGDDQWVPGDAGATYAIDLAMADAAVTGTFTGTFQGRAVQGAIRGSATGAGWRGGAGAAADGYRVAWDLGKRRTGWNHARWAVYELSRTTDLTAADGLQLSIATASPRHDTAVDVALMEEDGSWWHAHAAVALSTAERRLLIDFDDLRQGEFVFNEDGTGPGMDGNWDEDFRFDASRVRRIAVGVVDGRGVGEVAFTIRDLQAASWKQRPTTPARVALGGTMSVNGQREVPDGIFGFHVTVDNLPALAPLRPGSNRTCTALSYGAGRMDRPAPEHGTRFMVTGVYDRKQQLPQAGATSAAEWRDKTREAGRRLGELAKPLGANAVVEWWNEPYLDLGKMLDGFKQLPYPNPEGVKPGDPVVHNGEKLASMIWVEGRLVGEGKKQRKVFDAAKGPIWRDEGAPQNAAGGTPALFAVDPSRFSYWSGRQIGDWYNQTFLAMAPEAKAIAPELKLVGGFGFRWQEDNWASWELLHKPLVDAAWQHLDGLCDHRYQGLPEGTLASYEFLAAYSDVRYGKRLKGYNTEANDLWDAPARGGSVQDADEQKRYVARRRAFWNLRDLLLSVALVPDKAVARAIHAQWKVDASKLPADAAPWQRIGIHEGEYKALHLIRNLRGRLIQVATDDPALIAAAAADPVSGNLVLAIYNDGRMDRDLDIDLSTVAGIGLKAGTRSILQAAADGRLGTDSAPQEPGRAALRLPSGAAVCFELPLAQPLAADDGIVRVSRFADGFLLPIAPGGSVTLPLRAEPSTAGAKALRARLVLERCTSGEGWVEIGGARVPIPHSPSIPNTPRIVIVDLPPAAAGATTITIGANGADAGDGFLLCAAAIEAER